ncbi:hypothetical protein LR48_Vigan08g100800 [Vigna angularis]|uniref:Uncharacterized protein n=1 Tax=Phaseolus angularis TaxID=3914 RepID=A0A0L9V585_PHAAN|nr:hypothetical protein LR48_Vigan08g100800 [Vigna angularis]
MVSRRQRQWQKKQDAIAIQQQTMIGGNGARKTKKKKAMLWWKKKNGGCCAPKEEEIPEEEGKCARKKKQHDTKINSRGQDLLPRFFGESMSYALTVLSGQCVASVAEGFTGLSASVDQRTDAVDPFKKVVSLEVGFLDGQM